MSLMINLKRSLSSQALNKQILKVKKVKKRNLALVKKTKVKNSDRVIAPFDFNPALPKILNVLAKHHRTMHNGRK